MLYSDMPRNSVYLHNCEHCEWSPNTATIAFFPSKASITISIQQQRMEHQSYSVASDNKPSYQLVVRKLEQKMMLLDIFNRMLHGSDVTCMNCSEAVVREVGCHSAANLWVYSTLCF